MGETKLNGEPLRVLLVEDNPAHAELVIRGLEDHHVANQIHHVSDGALALDYLLRQGEYQDPKASSRPDIILLDLRLPKVDGLEVLAKIKSLEELKTIPVVVLTTSKAEADVARAYEGHVNSYLVKPIDFEKFASMMQDMGFYWMAWNQKPWNGD